MAAFGQQLQNRARDFEFALDRLIGIGVDAERDRADAMAGLSQFGAQNLDSVGFGVDFRFEIDARRQAQIRVRRAREAIHAAVLAAAVGIERQAVRNVGRFVRRQNAFGGVMADFGDRNLDRRRRIPAVVKRVAAARFEAPDRRADRAAPFVNRNLAAFHRRLSG